jgi:hypothetical protein
MLGGSSERRSTPTMPERGLPFPTQSCPVLDTSTTGHRHQDGIGGPDGTVIDEASLVFPIQAGLRLGGYLTDTPTVFGAPTEPVRANTKAPPVLWTGALCSSRGRGREASERTPGWAGRTVQFYGLVVDQEARPNATMRRSNPFDVGHLVATQPRTSPTPEPLNRDCPISDTVL